MPTVKTQAADTDSYTGFAWFVLRFPPYAGAVYSINSSKLHFTEEGSIYFSNNQAGDSGGKYCDPCPR